MRQPSVLAFGPSDPGTRRRDLGLVAGLGLWLAYTRFFPALQTVHATIPACPFLVLTGHPCPFCGGTRSFAHMWSGDLRGALLLYPLGPILFVATLAVSTYGIWALASGRTLLVRPTSRQRIWVVGGLGLALAASWSAKLLWLGP